MLFGKKTMLPIADDFFKLVGLLSNKREWRRLADRSALKHA